MLFQHPETNMFLYYFVLFRPKLFDSICQSFTRCFPCQGLLFSQCCSKQQTAFQFPDFYLCMYVFIYLLKKERFSLIADIIQFHFRRTVYHFVTFVKERKITIIFWSPSLGGLKGSLSFRQLSPWIRSIIVLN